MLDSGKCISDLRTNNDPLMTKYNREHELGDFVLFTIVLAELA